MSQPITMIILMVIAQLMFPMNNHQCHALVGYDCSHNNINITSFSLLDTEPCMLNETTIITETKIIQLIQTKKVQPIEIYQCLIDVFRVVTKCSWFDDSQQVSNGIGGYIVDISRDSCYELHKTGVWHADSNLKISNIHPNSTTRRSLTLAGSVSSTGSCTGSDYSDQFGSWNKVTVQADVSVTISTSMAYLELGTKKIILPSGTRCSLPDGRCFDIQGGHTFWDSHISLQCEDNDYDVLYEGPSTYTPPSVSTSGDHLPAVYTVDEDDIVFALTARTQLKICYQQAISTEHPKLFIIPDTGSGFNKRRSNPDVMNTDIFTYINTKLCMCT